MISTLKNSRSLNKQLLPALIINATLAIISVALYFLFNSDSKDKTCSSFSRCAGFAVDDLIHGVIVFVILIPVTAMVILLIIMFVIPYLKKVKKMLDEKYGVEVDERSGDS
jgi:hypothetical protein